MQKPMETNLEILTSNLKRERYIKENIEQLKQQQRLYSDRLKEIEFELRTEQITLQTLEVQSYAAEKAIKDIQYDNLIVFNKIRKYDKVVVIADHEFKGEIGHVVEISPDYEFPYLLEFINKETQRKNADGLLWKAEELEIL